MGILIDVQVTLQDIAKELDLSATTVSRSLRHDRLINPETRARVNEAARRLGYQGRVRRPRRAVDQETKSLSLGLLIPYDNLDAAHRNGNLMQMMAGIMAVMDEQGMHLKVHPCRLEGNLSLKDSSRLLPLIDEGSCRALIVHGDQDERDLAHLSARVPVVSMGRIYRDLRLDAAVADNVEGVQSLVKYLVELGHRRISWVGSNYIATFMQARKTGFVQGCLTHGLELTQHSFFGQEIYRGQSSRNDIFNTGALVEAVRSHGVTAFVCGNDIVALEVMNLLMAAGVQVPENVSVTGFDGWQDPASVRQITSFDPSFFEIGKAAARMALQRLAYPMDDPHIVSVLGKIVEGNSTAPVPAVLGN